MSDVKDGLNFGDKISFLELKRYDDIYHSSIKAEPTGEISEDGSPEMEIKSTGSLGSVQIQTVNLEGESQDVSQGFGLGIRQHDQVRLANGDTRYVEHEDDMSSGEFMILRLNIRQPIQGQHHVENREVVSGEGSLRFRVYDVTGNENLFPGSPNRLPIVNQKGAFIEDPNDVQAEFFSYTIQGTDPFDGQAGVTRINNKPLPVSPGGFLQADGSGAFADDKGRHYQANRTYAVVIPKTSGTGDNFVYYNYQWHEH